MASADEPGGPLSGHVEADEAHVGGERSGGKRGRGAEGKTIVFGMAERGGDVRAGVVPDVKAKTIEPIIEQHVAPGSVVSTDELGTYNRLAEKGYEHGAVNHGAGEYVDGIHHVNSRKGSGRGPSCRSAGPTSTSRASTCRSTSRSSRSGTTCGRSRARCSAGSSLPFDHQAEQAFKSLPVAWVRFPSRRRLSRGPWLRRLAPYVLRPATLSLGFE